MFTRVVQLTGAKDIDGGIAFVRDTVTPVLRQQHGYRGVTASADRAGGVLGVLTLWDSETARDASESALLKTREEAAKLIGGTLAVEIYEETYREILQPPKIGSQLLIRRVSMDPRRVDENIAYFNTEIVPQIKAQPGLMAIRHMINRSTGNAVAGTVWTDRKALDAAAETAQQRQAQSGDRVTFGEQSKREVVFVELQ